MYDHAWIGLIIVAMKISGHYGVIVMFNVKDMTLESINDFVFCLTYILNVAPFAFQAIYEIVALVSSESKVIMKNKIMQYRAKQGKTN